MTRVVVVIAGIAGFDTAAKARGIFAISGASSFPALSCAAIKRLLPAFERVDAVRLGIAPSPRVVMGGNVIKAITTYAGRPVPSLKDGMARFTSTSRSAVH